MKIRNGFVSNSSSSSFALIKKDEEKSLEERTELSKQAWLKCFDEESLGDGWGDGEIEKFVQDGGYALFVSSVDWNACEDIQNIIPRVLKAVGYDENAVTIKWVDM